MRYFLIAQLVKNLPAMEETPGLILGLGRSTGEGIGYPLEWVPHGLYWGFSCGSASKESACNVGDLDLIPELGRIPLIRERLPTPVFWPGEFHGL